MSEANRNKLQKRIAPGFWIDANGDGHISLPELLQVAELPDTPENREIVSNMVKEMLKQQHPGGTIIERQAIVHFMGFGITACLMHGPPSTWPINHKWDSDWKNVNCAECLAGKDLIQTFKISDDGKSITCLHCETTSHNPNDVEKHFCVRCGIFHDDIWPPARKAWISKP